MGRSIQRNFVAGGRPRWKPRKLHYSHPILDKTGLMRDTAEQSTSEWHHGSSKHTMDIYGPEYGLIHQYTGVKTKVGGKTQHIVREYIVVQPSEEEDMIAAFDASFFQK